MEIAILAFPLLLVTFIAVQAALVFYARSTALAAATQGAHAARGYANSSTAGPDKARAFLTRIGWGLRDPDITMTSTSTEIILTVSGTAPSIIPGMSFPVSQRAHGAVERFTR